MFKRLSCLLLSMVLFYGLLPQQVVAAGNPDAIQSAPQSAESAQSETASQPKTHQLFVNGVCINNAKVLYQKGFAYVPLRSVSHALCPGLTFLWENNTANLSAENLTVTVQPGKNYVTANGRCLYLADGVLFERGIIYIPAKTVADIFNATYSYVSDTQSIYFRSGIGTITPADEFYNSDDLYWLSHIIHAESGNQPLTGKIAVGNVVMNRVADPAFPNTIYDVVFQKNQFTPARTGTINLTPNEESVIAAKLCLEGAVVLPTALFFNHIKSSSWAAKHKTYITTIGGHAFYA